MKTCIVLLVIVMAYSRLSPLSSLIEAPTVSFDGLETIGADFNIEVMISNFIKGAKLDGVLPHSAPCGHANLYFVGNMTAAVQEFMKVKSLNNFYGVMEAFGLMTPLVEECFETFVDVGRESKTYFSKFKSITGYIDSFKANFRSNFLKITAEATQLRNDLANLDFNEAALDFGELLYEMFLFNPATLGESFPEFIYDPAPAGIRYNANIPSNFQDFFDGYLNGTVVFNTTHNLACANSSRWWIESIDAAVIAFNKGGADNVKAGWMYIAQSFSQLYPLSYNCITGVEEQIAAFLQNADWEEPWNIAYRVGRNLPAIRSAVTSMVTDIQSQSYYAAGNDIGSLVYFLLFEEQE